MNDLLIQKNILREMTMNFGTLAGLFIRQLGICLLALAWAGDVWADSLAVVTNGVDVKKGRSLLLRQCKLDLEADSLLIKNIQQQVMEVERDRKKFLKAWNSTVVGDAFKTNVYCVGGSKVQRIEKIHLTDRSKKIRRIVAFLSGQDNPMATLYEKYSGKSARQFLEQFESDYKEALSEYSNVTKKMENLDRREGEAIDKVSSGYAVAREENARSASAKILQCEKDLAQAEKYYDYYRKMLRADWAGKSMSASERMEKMAEYQKKADDMEKRVGDLKAELATLRSNLETYRQGGENSKELAGVASVRRKYDRQRHAVQTAYTHSVELREIVDKYTLMIEKDIVDRMELKIDSLKSSAEMIAKKNQAREAVLKGDVELSDFVVAGFNKKKTSETLAALGLVNYQEEEDRKLEARLAIQERELEEDRLERREEQKQQHRKSEKEKEENAAFERQLAMEDRLEHRAEEKERRRREEQERITNISFQRELEREKQLSQVRAQELAEQRKLEESRQFENLEKYKIDKEHEAKELEARRKYDLELRKIGDVKRIYVSPNDGLKVGH